MGDSVSTAGLITGVNGSNLYTELEALHLSRQDNPFVLKMASQDNLDELPLDRQSLARCHSQSVVSAMSPEPPYSPTKSCDPLVLSEIHDHMIRSPPPVHWPSSDKGAFPLSPRSNGTFSPDSSDGLDLDYGGGNSGNYYTRSQSEEHILSPCRDLLKTGMMSPTSRAVNTPELLMTTSMHVESTSSPRGSHVLGSHNPRQKVRRNHTFNMSTSGTADHSPSPFRNQMSYGEKIQIFLNI